MRQNPPVRLREGLAQLHSSILRPAIFHDIRTSSPLISTRMVDKIYTLLRGRGQLDSPGRTLLIGFPAF